VPTVTCPYGHSPTTNVGNPTALIAMNEIKENLHKYALCRSLISELQLLHSLSEKEYLTFSEDVQKTNKILLLMEPYLLFKIAYDEFLEWKVKYGKITSSRYEFHKTNQKRLYLEINYRICIILSFLRQFVDQSANLIADEYGKDSELSSRFKKETHLIYDSEFYYRFSYRLRNYSLHRYIPIRTISINYSYEDQIESSKNDIIINKEELLKEKDVWGSALYKELLNYDNEINAFDLVDGIFKFVLKLHTLTFNFVVQENRDSIQRIASFIFQFEQNEGELVLQKLWTTEDYSLKMNLILIPEQLIRDLTKSKIT